MSKKIIGVTVGTTISLNKIENELKPVRSVNGTTPDENGNVEINVGTGGTGEAGENGATFTPDVSADGVLSWTNDKGLNNPAPVNIKGADGADGKDGKDGYTPVKGVDYFDGKDGADGKDGTNGKDGAKGEKGDKGDQGIQGEKGEKGEKGDQGIQGIQGIQGEKGDKGDKGDTGAAGKDGVNGKDGKDGINGADGKDGIGIVDIALVAADGWTLKLENTRSYSSNFSMTLKFADGSSIVVTDVYVHGDVTYENVVSVEFNLLWEDFVDIHGTGDIDNMSCYGTLTITLTQDSTITSMTK